MLVSDEYFSVIHLAAIVGDPACKLNEELAIKTNWDSSVWLLDRAKELGISRFIFASTCSNYGKMIDSQSYVDENSSLAPVSLYAELKVDDDAPTFFIRDLAEKDFFFSDTLKLNKPIVLSFFATHCVPCRAEMPELDTLSTEYTNVNFYLVDILY